MAVVVRTTLLKKLTALCDNSDIFILLKGNNRLFSIAKCEFKPKHVHKLGCLSCVYQPPCQPRANGKRLLSKHFSRIYKTSHSIHCIHKNSKNITETRLEDNIQHRKMSNANNNEEDTSSPVFTIPNALTMSRVILSPIIGYLILYEDFPLAAGLFAYAGVSDLLDGYIARNYKNQKSVLGSFLDPLADKLLISVLYITLTAVGLIPVPLTALIISRDIALILAAFYVRFVSLPPPKTLSRYFDITFVTARLHPTFISKVNTAVQFSLVAFTLGAPLWNYTDSSFLHGLWYMTGVTTLWSGMSYVFSKKSTYEIYKTNEEKSKSTSTRNNG